MTARKLHGLIAPVIAVFLLYIGLTGVLVQIVDIKTLLSHAPASDPNMQAIRESLDGPSSFSVIETPDFDAPALPADLLSAAKVTALASAAQQAAAPPLRFVELRMQDGQPIGQVMTDTLLRFDAASLAALPVPEQSHGPRQSSEHLVLKQWHRTWAFGDGMLWLNALIGIGLGIMVVTGVVQYLQLFRARLRLNRKALVWSAGGLWRTWHRGIALFAALFLTIVAVSGTLLSVDSFALQVFRWTHPDELWHGILPIGMMGDFSSPLAVEELPSMLSNTLDAYHRAEGDRPIKMIRLRYFAGMPQGVIIAGGEETQQFVFNAKTGNRVTSSEPGYPYMGFPFGWHEHELMKQIHRGDILGVPGRVVDLLAGLSLVYLCLSGLWLYTDLAKRRRKSKRATLALVLLAGAGLLAQPAWSQSEKSTGWTPVKSIDFSPKHDVLIRNEDGTLQPMDQPYDKAAELAPGIWQIESDGDFHYLIKGTEQSLAIDSGYGAGNLRDYLEKLSGGPVRWIANTHYHFDHTANDAYFDMAFQSPETAEKSTIPYPSFAGLTFPRDYPRTILKDGDIIHLGDRDILVLMIPNHTPGGTAYLDRKSRILFVGDEVMGRNEPLNISVAQFADNMRKLEAHRTEFDTLAGGPGIFPASTIEAYLAAAEDVLAGKKGQTPPPWHPPTQAHPGDPAGVTIYDRRRVRAPDRPPAMNAGAGNRRVMTHGDAGIIYDITKIK